MKRTVRTHRYYCLMLNLAPYGAKCAIFATKRYAYQFVATMPDDAILGVATVWARKEPNEDEVLNAWLEVVL